MIEPPARLVSGRYTVGDLIARSERASVWGATARGARRRLAIKFLDPRIASNIGAAGRFFQTARIMAEVSGAHVPRVLDVGSTESGVPFVVMARSDGESLAALLARAGRLPLATVTRVVRDVARALAPLHASGLVHRNVTPRDILLVGRPPRESALLLGFGHSVAFAQAPVFDAARLDTSAHPSSPGSLAPELLVPGPPIDGRADLWSLGVVAFVAATGASPFDAAEPSARVERGSRGALEDDGPHVAPCYLHGALPVPSEVARDLPSTFDAWFARACAIDPRERFATADALGSALLSASELPLRTEPYLEPPSAPAACPRCGGPLEVTHMAFCATCGSRLSATEGH